MLPLIESAIREFPKASIRDREIRASCFAQLK